MGGAGKGTGKCSDGNPTGGAGAHLCRECPPHSPGPIDEFIAALRAKLPSILHIPPIMDLILFPMRIEEGLKSKSLPQFSKDYPVKGLMHTC